MEATKPAAATPAAAGESGGVAAAAPATTAADANDAPKSAAGASPSEDFLLFGARPSHLFDDIALAIDSLLTEEVAGLPLLPRTVSEQEQKRHAAGGGTGKPMTGEEKLVSTLRKAYKKNIDLAEAYCSRNIFTVQQYPKTKRRKILEAYLGEGGAPKEGEGTAGTEPPPPLPESTFAAPEGKVPTPEQLVEMDKEILVTRERLQQEKQKRVQLKRQLERLNQASQTLMGVQEELKKSLGEGKGGEGDVEKLAASVKSAVEGHKELKMWNARAEEVLQLLDQIKVEREEGTPAGAAVGGNGTIGREEDERQRKRMLEEIGGGAGAHGTKQEVDSLLKKIRGE
ncbi:hypothetical protein ACHAXT_004516 [Thalassiosira profunda]